MAAEDCACDISDRYSQLHREKCPIACRIQRTRHTDDLMLGEACDLVKRIDHGIERIGEDDAKGIWSIFFDPIGNVGDDLDVCAQQVFPCHTSLTGLSCCDDDHIGALDIFVVRGACDVGVVVAMRSHFHKIQCFALHRIYVVRNIQHNDVSHFFLGSEHREDLADLASADECDFLSHTNLLGLLNHY